MNDKKRELWSRYGLYGIVCLTALIIVAVIAIFVGQDKKREDATETDLLGGVAIVVNDNTEEERFTYDFSTVGLKKDAYQEINELANKYLEALRLGDVETLNKILQSENKLTEGNVNATGDYVEAYENISCYTMDGLEENTYVVYVVYDEKLLEIATPAPSMIRLYVCRDKNTQGVYIYNGTLTGELKTYMEMADSNEDVTILKSEVNRRFMDACGKDTELAEVYHRLQQSMVGTQPAAEEEAETKNR